MEGNAGNTKRKQLGILSIGLLTAGLVGALVYAVNHPFEIREDSQPLQVSQVPAKASPIAGEVGASEPVKIEGSSTPSTLPSQAAYPPPDEALPVANFVKQESLRMSQVDTNPQATEQRLKNYASTLSSAAFAWLAHTSLNKAAQADQRFFAASLLAMSESKVAIPSLADVVNGGTPHGNPGTRGPVGPSVPIGNDGKGRQGGKDPNSYHIEKTIRAMAIEGLSKFPDDPQANESLRKLASTENEDPFLVDRARRALYGMTKHDKDNLKKQDEAALKGMLNESQREE